MATCADCEYFFQPECHRYPPTISQGSRTPVWSTVDPDDWCGEWKQSAAAGGLTLTSLTPNSLPAGSTPATVDVYGTGFDSTCTVYADGVTRATFFIDIGHLEYTARPDQATSGETHQMTVGNTLGRMSNALTFTFT
jgi:hypothetical protein